MSEPHARRAKTVGDILVGSNPWLWDPKAVHEPVPDVALEAAYPAASGPTAPHPGIPTPDAVDRLPRRRSPVPARVWWVGVHGGAGETTLATLLPGSRAAGHAWPVIESSTAAGGAGAVVLVARTSMSGLRAAQRAAGEWASGSACGVDLLGLALIADAPGRLPRPLKDFAAIVAGGVPRVWHLPWIESWRLGEDPSALSAPRSVRRLIADVSVLVPTSSAAARGLNLREVHPCSSL